jgi:hypothetical protein
MGRMGLVSSGRQGGGRGSESGVAYPNLGGTLLLHSFTWGASHLHKLSYELQGGGVARRLPTRGCGLLCPPPTESNAGIPRM